MTIEETLAERGARYGDFTDRAILAQQLQDAMRREPVTHFSREGWDRLSPDKRQALTVIADKIARILTGDPEYRDNWHDIQGYAKLAEDRCAGQAPQTLYEKVVDRERAWPSNHLRVAVENALEVASSAKSAPDPAVVLALCNVLNIINQKKDD